MYKFLVIASERSFPFIFLSTSDGPIISPPSSQQFLFPPFVPKARNLPRHTRFVMNNHHSIIFNQGLLVIKFLLAFAVYIADVNLLWLIAIFILSNRIFTEGICRLCDLVIADLIDQDFVENERKVTASAFFYGTAALLTKPGQSLAPIIGTVLLTVAAGSEDIRARTEQEALTQEDFKSYCLVLTGVPMICSIVQILIWVGDF